MATRKKKAADTIIAESPSINAPAAMNFTHTRLLVEDMDACYKFYRDALGLKPKFDGEGSVYAEFEFNGHLLALFSRALMNKAVGSSAGAARADACDSIVVAFEVADVDQTCAALKARGVSFVTEPHDQQDWLLRVAHFRDPDGHLLEINAALQAPRADPVQEGN